MRVKMAARAKKTNARGEESPEAELGAEVEEVDPVAEVVLDPVVFEDPELVLEAEDDVLELEPVVIVELDLMLLVLVTVGREEEPVEEPEEEPVEEPEVDDAAAEELLTPPINWNCVL